MNFYLILCLLFKLSIQNDALEKFVKTQEKTYQKIAIEEDEIFTHSIDDKNLFSSKSHFLIKAKNSHSNKASYNLTVYTRINLWKYDFETKEKCKQAQDSLLNSFPNHGAPIKRNVNISYKITPSIFIFNEKSICIAKTNCEQVDEKWPVFLKEFSNAFSDKDAEIIKAECGKITWVKKEQL